MSSFLKCILSVVYMERNSTHLEHEDWKVLIKMFSYVNHIKFVF